MENERRAAEKTGVLRDRAACVTFLAILILGFASAAGAQDAEISRTLTLKEAVSLAVANSRDLALARLQYGVLQREANLARSVFRPNL